MGWLLSRLERRRGRYAAPCAVIFQGGGASEVEDGRWI